MLDGPPKLNRLLLHVRIDVFEFLQQPLVLPADQFLVAQQYLPRGKQFRVFGPQGFVLLNVEAYKFGELRTFQLRQSFQVDVWRSRQNSPL